MTNYLLFGGLGLVWLIGAALTYSKAEGEGRNGSGWGLFALIAGPVAWIAYAMTGDHEPMGVHEPINSQESMSSHALHTAYTRNVTQTVPDIASRAEKDFSDPYVDRLIAKGDLKTAKEAIAAMIATAKETHDLTMLADYEAYGLKIRHMELDAVRKDAPTPIAGPPMEFTDGPSIHGGHAAHVSADPNQALI